MGLKGLSWVVFGKNRETMVSHREKVLHVWGTYLGELVIVCFFAMLSHVCRGPRCVAVVILRCSAGSIQIRWFSNADVNV